MAQIVGKLRLGHSPLINHWWQVTLYVTSRGLTTSSIPYQGGAFDIEFDFIDHHLLIRSSEGDGRTVALAPKPVAEFYAPFPQVTGLLSTSTPGRRYPRMGKRP